MQRASTQAAPQSLDADTAQLGRKRAEVLMPIRIAFSGWKATPPLFETLSCLGKAAAIRRLDAMVASLPAG